MAETARSKPDIAASGTPIQCIITVHGMGEPRFNSTLMPVVEQIVKAAYPKLKGDTMTLGGICGLTGLGKTPDPSDLPCFALEGIGANGNPEGTSPVLLKAVPCDAHADLCFADIFWSGITSDVFDDAGDDLTHWTECLINRLERHRMTHDRGEGPWWVMDMLYLLRRTLVFAEKAVSWRSKEVSDLVFGSYLGDVQLYGEFPQVRGKAVRHFHETMARIHEHLSASGRKVEYTVIAHSLGTVLSLDALTLAHYLPFWEKAGGTAGAKSAAVKHPPVLPGYAGAQPLPKLDWIDSVRAFVTLGSPIDKFLTLWWFNYRHLADVDWIRTRRPARPIPHYNFCDEQDPVGARLDFARTAPAFAAIFAGDPARKWNDVVYNHSPIPGAAHTSYWADASLFDLLYRKVIKGGDGAPQDLAREDWKGFRVYRRDVFFWILMIHYYLVPILVMGVCNFFLTLALMAEGWHTRGMGMLGFLLSAWYGRTALMLNIGWRRALKNDSLNSPELDPQGAGKLEQARKSFLYDRESHARNARVTWYLFFAGSWIASLGLWALLWKGHGWRDALLSSGMPATVGSGIVLSAILIIMGRLSAKGDHEADLPASLKENRAWGGRREIPLVLLALSPALLMSCPYLGDPVAGAISSVSGWLGWTFALPGGRAALKFLGALAEIAALGWVEVIWTHAWIKRCFSRGHKRAGLDSAWQRDFKRYVEGMGGEEGPR
jgi:hypothetical protein